MAKPAPEDPLLVLDMFEKGRGRTFRVVASRPHSIAANLSLANMDFEDYADSVDEDRVFRGF